MYGCLIYDGPLHLQQICSGAPLQVVVAPAHRAPRSAWVMRYQLGNSMDVQFATAEQPGAAPRAGERANRASQHDAADDEQRGTQQPPSQPVTGSITAAVP